MARAASMISFSLSIVCKGVDMTSLAMVELATRSFDTTLVTMSPSVTIPIGSSLSVMTTLPALEAVIFSEISLIEVPGLAVMTGLFITSRTSTFVLTGGASLAGVLIIRLFQPQKKGSGVLIGFVLRRLLCTRQRAEPSLFHQWAISCSLLSKLRQ